jgi:TolA-binding protein
MKRKYTVILRHDDRGAAERKALEPLREELQELRKRHQDDPPLELLRAARAGVLPDELQETAQGYLEHSAWSRALVEGADNAEAALDSKEEMQLLARIHREARKSERPRTSIFSFRRLAIVSATALIIVSAVVLRRLDVRSGRTPSPQNPPVAAESPAHATTSPPLPVFVLALEKPPIKITANALLFRGSPGNNRFLDDLAPAMTAYREGDYVQAEKQFTALTTPYPKSTEVYFYMGVSRLFMRNFSGAVQALESARKLGDASFAPDVSWYLAISYERARRPGDARTELDSLCGGKSTYTARACEAKERLR